MSSATAVAAPSSTTRKADDWHVLADRSVVAAAIRAGRYDPEPDLHHLAGLVGTGVGAWGAQSAFAGVSRIDPPPTSASGRVNW